MQECADDQLDCQQRGGNDLTQLGFAGQNANSGSGMCLGYRSQNYGNKKDIVDVNAKWPKNSVDAVADCEEDEWTNKINWMKNLNLLPVIDEEQDRHCSPMSNVDHNNSDEKDSENTRLDNFLQFFESCADVEIKCKLCRVKFQNIRKFASHMELDHPNAALLDAILSQQEQQLLDFSSNRLAIPEINVSSCETSASSSKKEDDLGYSYRFMKYHGKYPCTICRERLPNLRRLKYHNIEFHMNAPPYKCNLVGCGYSSCDKNIFKEHMKRHKGDTPYECKSCEQVFTNKANCERHIRNIHDKSDREEIQSIMSYTPQESNEQELHSFMNHGETAHENLTHTGSILENLTHSRSIQTHSGSIQTHSERMQTNTVTNASNINYPGGITQNRINIAPMTLLRSNGLLSPPVQPLGLSMQEITSTQLQAPPVERLDLNMKKFTSTIGIASDPGNDTDVDVVSVTPDVYPYGMINGSIHPVPLPNQNLSIKTPNQINNYNCLTNLELTNEGRNNFNNYISAINKGLLGSQSLLMKKYKQQRFRTERPWKCPECDQGFTLRSNMLRHIKKQQHYQPRSESSNAPSTVRTNELNPTNDSSSSCILNAGTSTYRTVQYGDAPGLEAPSTSEVYKFRYPIENNTKSTDFPICSQSLPSEPIMPSKISPLNSSSLPCNPFTIEAERSGKLTVVPIYPSKADTTSNSDVILIS